MKQVACLLVASGVSLGCWASPAMGQISSDGTLPTNIRQSGNVFEITGGATAGSNLFHSFQNFSVPTNNTAFFNNPANIVNIINRVTGGNISNIDGLIRANGSANVILINPDGINFGPNARLNIGGSFLGSTASSLKFADGSEFSARNPQSTPLLTISVPLGLQMEPTNEGKIRVQGSGHRLTVADPIFSPVTKGISPTGLSVQPGQTIALVGGDIALEGGTLTAEGGRIELGSVAEGEVILNTIPQGWTLNYEAVQDFRDIDLRSQALADASSGSIQVQGRRFSVQDGSLLLIQNQGFQPAGNIFVNARDAVEISGTNADGTIRSSLTNETVGLAEGGDVVVSTRQLVVQGGATIVAKTFSPATGGDVNLNASESVQVIGASDRNPSVTSSIVAATFGPGKSGNNTLSTGRLAAVGGGTVATATFGSGDGGELRVSATDSIDLIGVEPNLFAPSALIASAFNSGDAGNLTVNTAKLTLQNGGRVDSSTFGSGAAGGISINASDFVEVKGTVVGSLNPSLIISSANLVDESLQQIFGLPPVPSGASGDVTINTRQLRVKDGAQVTVRNDGSGDAGNLLVNANSIDINDTSGITAVTTSGQGGNISLQVQDSLEMRRNSRISATAGGTGNGGNMTINTDILVALENSDITADAIRGAGGNVQINTQGLFVCKDCQISATSALGLDGVVEIITQDNASTLDVLDVSEEVADPEEVVAQACPARRGRAKSEFTITGRGGLPTRPSEPLNSEALVSFEPSPRLRHPSVLESSDRRKPPIRLSAPKLGEGTGVRAALGWYINAQGLVVLTADPTTATPYVGVAPPECQDGQGE